MKLPEKQEHEKPREVLWKETIVGFVVMIFGMSLIWNYMDHSGHGHKLDKELLVIGACMMSFGGWMINKKLSSEWMAEVRKFIPFLGNKQDNDK